MSAEACDSGGRGPAAAGPALPAFRRRAASPWGPSAPAPARRSAGPLPTRAFVPGHPLAALRQRPAESPPLASAEAWLHGADLYSAGFLWEAHEAWEHPWQALRRSPAGTPEAAEALALQGLIQAAAGCLKLRTAELRPARRLLAAGLTKLERALALEPACAREGGLDLSRFTAGLARFAPRRPADWRRRPPL